MRPILSLALALCLSALGGCAFISRDETAEALRAHADLRVSFSTPALPAQACSKVARMLMWCAGGPNFHYRCNVSPDNSKAELTGVLEAIYRTEVFMVTDFVKAQPETAVTVQQRESILVYTYAPLIEKFLNGNAECQPR